MLRFFYRLVTLRIPQEIRFRNELRKFQSQQQESKYSASFPPIRKHKVLIDYNDSAGVASGHYFHQDLYVAQKIFLRNPVQHLDVGSRIDGFVAHVASFRKIDVLDTRPINSDIKNIGFRQFDLLEGDLNTIGLYDSVSCLHTIEHFGLGRYGDPISYDGWANGISILASLLRVNGFLYLSFPTSIDQRIEFNAHRVFSLPFMKDVLSDAFNIEEIALVDDLGNLVVDIDQNHPHFAHSFYLNYGCSIWTLRKK